MAEEKKEIKRSRGRPLKVEKEPIVDEAPERLSMTKKDETVTLDSLSQQYRSLFSQIMNLGGGSQVGLISPSFGALNLLNPFIQNQRLKQIYTQPSEHSKEEVLEALRHPADSEQILRSVSWEMTATQYLFYLLVRQSCDIPKYCYYKIPDYLGEIDNYKKDDFQDEDRLTDEWLEAFGVETTLKQKALEVAREGKSTYILRNSFCQDEKGKKHVNYATWQKLPSDWVKLTGVGENGFTASLNMMLFNTPGFSPIQYSDYIQKVWDAMTEQGLFNTDDFGNRTLNFDKAKNFSYSYNGQTFKPTIEVRRKSFSIEDTNNKNGKLKDVQTYMFWVILPQEICYTFASDTSHPWVVPTTTSLYSQLQNLLDYQALAGLIQSTPLIGILTAEADYIDNAQSGQNQTKISPDNLQSFMSLFNSITSTNVEAFFAPLKNFKLQTLPGATNSSDIVTKSIQDTVNQMGAGGTIITTEKPSIAQIKASNSLASEREHMVTLQFERVLNFILQNLLGLKYRWKIRLYGDVFNIESEKKYVKELVMGGDIALLPKLHGYERISSRDTQSLAQYIKSLDVYDLFRTLTDATNKNNSSNTTTQNDGSSVSVGRTKIDENEIESDATAQSIEQGDDISENKMIYNNHNDITKIQEERKCVICHQELESGENNICESCIEKYQIEIENEE